MGKLSVPGPEGEEEEEEEESANARRCAAIASSTAPGSEVLCMPHTEAEGREDEGKGRWRCIGEGLPMAVLATVLSTLICELERAWTEEPEGCAWAWAWGVCV